MLNLQLLSWHYSTPAWSCTWQLHPLNSSYFRITWLAFEPQSESCVRMWPGTTRSRGSRETNTKRNANCLLHSGTKPNYWHPISIHIRIYPYSIPIRISSSYHQKKIPTHDSLMIIPRIDVWPQNCCFIIFVGESLTNPGDPGDPWGFSGVSLVQEYTSLHSLPTWDTGEETPFAPC